MAFYNTAITLTPLRAGLLNPNIVCFFKVTSDYQGKKIIVGKSLVNSVTNITFNSIPSFLWNNTLRDDGMLYSEGQPQKKPLTQKLRSNEKHSYFFGMECKNVRTRPIDWWAYSIRFELWQY